MRIDFHPLFQSDLEDAALFYLERGGKELAESFLDEVENGIFRIAATPLASSIVFGEVRCLRLSRFQAYSIRYVFDKATLPVFIASLFHGSRHPDTDRDRF